MEVFQSNADVTVYIRIKSFELAGDRPHLAPRLFERNARTKTSNHAQKGGLLWLKRALLHAWSPKDLKFLGREKEASRHDTNYSLCVSAKGDGSPYDIWVSSELRLPASVA